MTIIKMIEMMESETKRKRLNSVIKFPFYFFGSIYN